MLQEEQVVRVEQARIELSNGLLPECRRTSDALETYLCHKCSLLKAVIAEEHFMKSRFKDAPRPKAEENAAADGAPAAAPRVEPAGGEADVAEPQGEQAAKKPRPKRLGDALVTAEARQVAQTQRTCLCRSGKPRTAGASPSESERV